MNRKPYSGTLKNFINQYGSFTIPYYQRKYVWSLPENRFILDKFIADIIDEYNENVKNGYTSNYYVGTVAIHNRNAVSLIDGQQRLTTLIVLLAEISKSTGISVPELYRGTKFVMSGGCSLGAYLEYFIYGKSTGTFQVPTPDHPLNKALQVIDAKIRALLQSRGTQYLAGLQQYILEHVDLDYSEFQTEKDALRHFLNINSYAAQLTEMEIFLAYTSQVIAFTGTQSITTEAIQSSLERVDQRLSKVSADDLVYVFLRAYFKDDHSIGKLNDKVSKTGIGKWLTGYKMDILSNPTEATAFITALSQYIDDIDVISTFMVGTNPKTYAYKYIQLISIFNKYTKNKYIPNLLEHMFINRHNYHSDDMYKKGTTIIDETKLNSFCKAAFAVVVNDIFAGDMSLLAKDTKADVKLSERTVSKKSPTLTIKNIAYSNMWNMKVPRDKQSSKSYRIPDDSECVFFILALQQAQLNHRANSKYSIVSILSELLDPNQNYQIEHLITKEDYTRSARLEKWQSKGMFMSPEDYDETRARFENLSIIDGPTNASASSDTISAKIPKYKNACSVMSTREPEYLIQSLIDGSSYYSNPAFSEERKISLDNNGVTWAHSENNRVFVENLTKEAVTEIFNDDNE